MTTQDVLISNFQLKQLFEEFNKLLTEPGENPKYSWFVFKNCEILAKPYSQLMQELYDERREPDFPAFYREQQEIVQKYADRDEQNNIIRDENGAPVFNENIVEFNQANKELGEKYADFCAKLQAKDKTNFEVLSKTQTLQLHCLELSEFPPRTPPYIVGILGY